MTDPIRLLCNRKLAREYAEKQYARSIDTAQSDAMNQAEKMQKAIDDKETKDKALVESKPGRLLRGLVAAEVASALDCPPISDSMDLSGEPPIVDDADLEAHGRFCAIWQGGQE